MEEETVSTIIDHRLRRRWSSIGAAVAADTPDSVLISWAGQVEVKLGDNEGNVLAVLSMVLQLEPYTWRWHGRSR